MNFPYSFCLRFEDFFIPLVIEGLCKYFFIILIFFWKNTERIKQACVKSNCMHHLDFYCLCHHPSWFYIIAV